MEICVSRFSAKVAFLYWRFYVKHVNDEIKTYLKMFCDSIFTFKTKYFRKFPISQKISTICLFFMLDTG